jgi:glycosyltransferase involved in cell wall biosynthesis
MKISVCIATYNGEKYIKEQLLSILNQIDRNDEVIISDDSSTDKTIDIIKSFEDSRIKIYEENKFFNPVLNFENALKKSTGDLVFLSDQDDIWHENKVSIVKEYLQKWDVVVTDCKIINENGSIINESFFDLNNSKNGFVSNFLKNSYLGCCMAFRRSALAVALPFPKNIPMHDIWLGFVFELFCKVKFLDMQLIYYRRHGNNVSVAGEKSSYRFLTKLKWRYLILKNLPGLLFKQINYFE